MLATGSSTPSSSTMALLGATFFAAAGAGVAGAGVAAAAPEDSEAAGAGAADPALGGVTTDFFLPPLPPFFPPVANHEIRFGTHAFLPRSAGHNCPVVRPDSPDACHAGRGWWEADLGIEMKESSREGEADLSPS